MSSHQSPLNTTLNLSGHKNALQEFANVQLLSNRDSTSFGVGFQETKNKYFKEYEVELLGKHSPGPANYSPNMTFFKPEKHDTKTFALVRYQN